jgi:hypothetical protein
MGNYSQKEVSEDSNYRTRFRDSMSKELDDYLNRIVNNLRIQMNKPTDINSLEYLLWCNKHLGIVPFVEKEEDEFKFLMKGIKVIPPHPMILTNLQTP